MLYKCGKNLSFYFFEDGTHNPLTVIGVRLTVKNILKLRERRNGATAYTELLKIELSKPIFERRVILFCESQNAIDSTFMRPNNPRLFLVGISERHSKS